MDSAAAEIHRNSWNREESTNWGLGKGKLNHVESIQSIHVFLVLIFFVYQEGTVLNGCVS